MATIERYSTKSGQRYMVRYRTPDHKQTSKRGFTTKRDANAFAALVETSKLRGEYVAPAAGRLTFGDAAASWLDSRIDLAATSRSRYRGVLTKHLLPRFAHVALADMTREVLRGYVAEISEDMAPGSVRKVVVVLAGVLDQAVEDKRLASNPATKLPLPRAEEQDKRFLTAEQVHALAAAAGAYSVAVYVLALCGLRFGELAALRVGDVDLDRARLNVRRSVALTDEGMVESSTKSRKARSVPVAAFVVEMLARQIDGRAADELVFPARGGAYMRLNNVRRRWWAKATADAEGVPSDLTPHELRHTCASLAIQAGANIKTLQRMLGHSSAALTLDRYGHLYDDDLGLVAEQLDKLRPALKAA